MSADGVCGRQRRLRRWRIGFGPNFEAAGPILRWLAIAGFIQPLINSLGWLYISQGRGRDLMKWGFVACALVVSSFVAGLPSGPLGVARAYAIMICTVVAPLAVWSAGSKGSVTRVDLAKLCCSALVIASPTIAASFLVSIRCHRNLLHWSSPSAQWCRQLRLHLSYSSQREAARFLRSSRRLPGRHPVLATSVPRSHRNDGPLQSALHEALRPVWPGMTLLEGRGYTATRRDL